MPFLVAISVGNTRTAVGHFHDDRAAGVRHFGNADLEGIVECVREAWAHRGEEDGELVVASVNDATAIAVEAAVASALQADVWRIGRDLEVPIGRCLDEGATPGQDRLLAAAAAFAMVKQSVIVVDAGTAVTVDFVDGEGVFHGGAILPGAQMQLDAMHARTAALPDVRFAAPEPGEAFGRNTVAAMRLGVFEGIRGGVRALVERYATSYGAFPLVIATGGDAEVLFDDQEIAQRVVPDLVLQGIRVAVQAAAQAE
ncbi:MAG: type pantothenate kinase [Planctomycetota bacterium]|jgi:type III pantothenate kinase